MEMHDPVAFEHHGVTTFVGLGVALHGTPWVTELRPAVQHLGERGEVLLGVLHEAAVAVDDQLPQPRVRVRAGRSPGPAPHRSRHRPDAEPRPATPARPASTAAVAWSPPAMRSSAPSTSPAPTHDRQLGSARSSRLDPALDAAVRGLELAARELQVDERPIEVGAAQFGHLPRRRNRLQIHTPNDREGVSQSCPGPDSGLRSGGDADRVVAGREPARPPGAVAAGAFLGDAFPAQLSWAALGPARNSGSVSLLPATLGLGRISSGPAGTLPRRRRGLRPRASTQTSSEQLDLPHGWFFACDCACASAFRAAFCKRRRSRNGAQTSQSRTLQIRRRACAIACCCLRSRRSLAVGYGRRRPARLRIGWWFRNRILTHRGVEYRRSRTRTHMMGSSCSRQDAVRGSSRLPVARQDHGGAHRCWCVQAMPDDPSSTPAWARRDEAGRRLADA